MQVKHQSIVRVVLSAIIGLNLTANVWAGGAFIGNEVISARSTGEGYVGVAGQNEDPSVVYSNPAGITKLKGTNLTIGGHWENIHADHESAAGVKTGANTVDVVIPNFSFTQGFL